MATLNEVDQKSKLYADARERLGNHVWELNDAIETAKRTYTPAIKRHLALAAEREADLRAAIKDSPDLFVKPRSLVLHGVKVGYQKAKGEISWTSVEQVVKLTREKFRQQFDVLIKTTYKPVKKALAMLPAQDLKKIGVTVGEDSDEVLIKDTASDIDKLVDALLKEAGEEES